MMKRKYYLVLIVFIVSLFSSCTGNNCNHEYGEWTINEYPSYYGEGSRYRNCELCGYQFTGSINPLCDEAVYRVEVLTEPTCKDEGKGRFTYLGEEMSLVVDAAIPMTNHQYVSHINNNNDEKYHSSTCGVCNQVINVTHEYINVEATESTCQVQGHSKGSACKYCNYSKNIEYYDLKSHEYTDGKCKWCEKDKVLTITYVYSEGNEKAVEVVVNSKFDDVEEPSTEEKAFLGWFKEDGTKVTGDYVLTENLMVYAKWSENILIYNKEDFIAIKNQPKKSYILKNNIDLDGITIDSIDSFSGCLEGNGYTISNFTLKATSVESNYGIFKVNKGIIRNVIFTDFVVNYNIKPTVSLTLGTIVGVNEGVIENVNIVNPNMLVDINIKNLNGLIYNISSIVGLNKGEINNCTVNGRINVNNKLYSYGTYGCNNSVYYNVGGIAGNNIGKITSCFSNIEIQYHSIAEIGQGENYGKSRSHVYSRIGLLSGINDKNGSISKSYSDAQLTYTYQTINTTDGSSHNYVMMGGLVGYNLSGSTINECYSNADISGGTETLTYVGGLVGINDDNAEINSSYSTSSINSGNQTVSNASYGGLVGYNNSTIRNSYSNGKLTSNVTSTNGGLVGANDVAGVIVKSYSNSIVTSSEGKTGEFVGVSNGIIEKSYYVSNQKYYPGNSSKPSLNDSSSVTGIALSELINKSFLQETLSMNDNWDISGFNLPILKWEIDSALHNFEEHITEATCTEDGYSFLYCEHCESIVITEFIAAKGHERIDDKVYGKLDATHTEDGYEIYLCSRTHTDQINGNYNYYEVILPALGHTIPETIKCSDEKCIYDEEENKYYYLCNCDDILITEDYKYYIEDESIIIHEEIDVNATSPSCEGDILGNTKGTKCKLCDNILSGCEPIQPHYFKYVETIKEATCMEVGSALYKCSLCNIERKEDISMTPHKYDNNSLCCSVCNIEKYKIDDTFISIRTVEDLMNIIKNPNKNYYLADNIDLKGYENFVLDFEFNGVFHGNGKTISNLTYNYSNKENVNSALFGIIGNNGVVVGLTIENVNVSLNNINNASVGVLACENYGTISNCVVTSSNGKSNVFKHITSVNSTNLVSLSKTYNYVTGLVVANNYGNIDYCKVTGNISIEKDFKAKYDANFNGLSNLGKTASVQNNTIIKYGSMTAINNGTISYSTVEAGIVQSSSYDSVVDGTGFGQAYTNIELYVGAFTGINSGTVISSKSVALPKLFIHDKTIDCYLNSYGLDSHLEKIRIKDYTVYETLEFVIGHSSNSLDTDITVIND